MGEKGTTSAQVNGLDVERIRWENELRQRMRSQVVWCEFSEKLLDKLINSLWLSSHGIDEAMAVCDELCDEIREMIQRSLANALGRKVE